MRVEVVFTPPYEYDTSPKGAIVSKTSAAGEGDGKHAAGLPDESVDDEDDDEDV